VGYAADIIAQRWQIAATKEALVEVDAGKIVSHEQVIEEVSKWGR